MISIYYLIHTLSHVEGSTDCAVEDVLVFFSGSDRVPPVGFPPAQKCHFFMVKHLSSALQAPVIFSYVYLLVMVKTTRHLEMP